MKLLAQRVPHPCLHDRLSYKHNTLPALCYQSSKFQYRKRETKIKLVEMADPDAFRLVLPAVDHQGRLPRKYTGEGQGAQKDISPKVEWYNVPEGTKSLALVVQDIDAPDPKDPIVPWVHWVVVNIPPTLKGLPEGFSGKEEEAGGEYGNIREGNNDFKVPGWRGAKLPNHGHRFEFKLYALDDEVHLGNKVTKDKLLEAIEGHVVGEAVVICQF